MNRIGCSVLLTLLCAAIAIGCVAASALGSRNLQDSIATINLGKLLSGLEETTRMKETLAAMEQEIMEYNAAKQAEIEAMQQRLETLEKGTPAYRELESQILMDAHQFRAYIDGKTALRHIEESNHFLNIYRKVLDAAQALAELQGYEFIILDDTNIDFQEGATPQQTLAQLFTRRLIYANPARDLTEELLTRMNNAFTAGVQE